MGMAGHEQNRHFGQHRQRTRWLIKISMKSSSCGLYACTAVANSHVVLHLTYWPNCTHAKKPEGEVL